MKYAYKLTNGRASDLRFVSPGYSPADGETVVNGDVLPELDALHTAATVDLVVAERERRLAFGFNYNFSDARGIHRIGTSDADMRGWDEVSKVSSAAIATNNPTMTLNIVTNTGPATVTAMEWQSVLLAAASFRQPIWAASFTLEATNPIPLDYAADSRWPAIQ